MLDFNVQGWGNAFCGFGPSFGNGPGFIGWIFPILFWLLIAYLIVSIIKSLFSWKREKTDDAALDILRAKFAAGEINDQEYSARKAVLNSK
ncbi:MAG: SHOCT domain-containing protein [Desulfocapsaceae bacterium]